MCGIIGAVAQRNVTEILLEGLKRLEYRGYDSAGIAVIDSDRQIERLRTRGKVSELVAALETTPLQGVTGIAHTRWATHGVPNQTNAHPHLSGNAIGLVHNGIIENHEHLRERLVAEGYQLTSDTDSELVAHLINYHLQSGKKDILLAVQAASAELEGAYALAVIYRDEPHRLIAVRSGSPLVLGLGIGEHFVASDPLALLPVTRRFVYLEEGDCVDVRVDEYAIYNAKGERVERSLHTSELSLETTDKGNYRHYMAKEIFEQPAAIAATLEGRLTTKNKIFVESFGALAQEVLQQVKAVQFVACGTSYHAAMVARYWIEALTGLPCQVEVASEYRYRQNVVLPNTLFVAISQSGETADTLAAMRQAKERGYLAKMAICNMPESSLVREADLALLTRAGIEIGVASTKAFTTQLTALLLLTAVLSQEEKVQQDIAIALTQLPGMVDKVLAVDPLIRKIVPLFADKEHALFLGRGAQYPIALEGALKLKEISYIHAEAYPAGELKHGPLALVDKMMPVIAVAPNDDLLEKLKSNLHEINARGGYLIVFADESIAVKGNGFSQVIALPAVHKLIAPIVYTIPLQLLAYHVAVEKGTDIDQPRNLAKSVTVE